MPVKQRYKVEPSNAFIHGARVWEVIDRKNDTVVYDSVLQSNCIARARKLNKQERAIPGGQNRRYK